MNEMKDAIEFNDLTDEEAREFMEGLVPAEVGDNGWKITTDLSADWAVRKIKEEQEEYFRLNKLAHDQIAEINMKIEDAERKMERRTSYLKYRLSQYFQTVPHKETKTQEQYKLLSGALVYTKPKQSLEKEDEGLLAYLKGSGFSDYVKTEEKPMWGEFKKILTVIDGKAVNTLTGETVDAVKVVEKEGTFEVK